MTSPEIARDRLADECCSYRMPVSLQVVSECVVAPTTWALTSAYSAACTACYAVVTLCFSSPPEGSSPGGAWGGELHDKRS